MFKVILFGVPAHPEREAVEGFSAKPFDRLRVRGNLGLIIFSNLPPFQ